MVFRYHFQEHWDIPISWYCGSLMPRRYPRLAAAGIVLDPGVISQRASFTDLGIWESLRR
jgi:hypothetical protein